jgi:hypothetical protein
MNVDCSFCEAKYSVSEELVRGRVAKFRCRTCGGIIPVDGRLLALFVEDRVDGRTSVSDPVSLRPLAVSTSGGSSVAPAPLAAPSVPAVATMSHKAEGRGGVARWIGLAGAFGLAVLTWKVFSPADAVRRPVQDAAVVSAAVGVEQPAEQTVADEENKTPGSTPVAAAPRSNHAGASAAVAGRTVRGSGASERVPADTSLATDTKTTPGAMPTSGFLPDPEPETDVPFDRRAALMALDAAGQRAQACKPPDTLGAMRVAVTFAPTGKVTTAVVEGPPFAGTRVGGCIAARLRDAAIAPFTGSPVTVHRSL